MADARVEQIMSAIATALTGLTTTGANVQRGQIYAHEAAKLPALSIYMGADSPENELITALMDWELTVLVETVAQIAASYTGYGTTIETSLAQIRKEVHAAMLADHTLGLSFVIDVRPGAVSQPQLEGEGDLPIGSQMLSFIVSYRASRADISA